MSRAPLAIAALLLSLAFAGGAAADLKDAEKSKHRVRQLLSIQYSTKFCNEANGFPVDFAYKVNTWSRRWSRRSTRREVSSATFRAHAQGYTCGGDPFQDRYESTWRPCFGCDGASRRWTPDYHGSPGWPYLYTPEDAENFPVYGLRFTLTGTVARTSGRTLGDICVRVTLFGRAPTC